jgi:hypothetical protein
MMFQTAIRKAALCLLGTGMVLTTAGTHSARAQHLVTDNEAGRLTLDALIAAPPPVRHIVYRHAAHMSPSSYHGYHVATASSGTRGLVHSAVYHPHAGTPVRHAARKIRHRT